MTAELVSEPKGQARKESSQGIEQEKRNYMRMESSRGKAFLNSPLAGWEHSRRAQVEEIIEKEIGRRLMAEILRAKRRKIQRGYAREGIF